jgi:hypothetical protein
MSGIHTSEGPSGRLSRDEGAQPPSKQIPPYTRSLPDTPEKNLPLQILLPIAMADLIGVSRPLKKCEACHFGQKGSMARRDFFEHWNGIIKSHEKSSKVILDQNTAHTHQRRGAKTVHFCEASSPCLGLWWCNECGPLRKSPPPDKLIKGN